MVHPPPTIDPNRSGDRVQTEDGNNYVQFEVNRELEKMDIIKTVSLQGCLVEGCLVQGCLRNDLLTAAFKHARKNKWWIETTCRHARKYAKDNPSWQSQILHYYIEETMTSSTETIVIPNPIERFFRDYPVLYIIAFLLLFLGSVRLLLVILVGLYLILR